MISMYGMNMKNQKLRQPNRAGQLAAVVCETADEERGPMWCTGPQLAKRLQVSVRTIAYWTEDGALPVYRKGRVVRYDLTECMQALGTFRRKSQLEGQIDVEC